MYIAICYLVLCFIVGASFYFGIRMQILLRSLPESSGTKIAVKKNILVMMAGGLWAVFMVFGIVIECQNDGWIFLCMYNC